MKKDNLISVGIVINRNTNLDLIKNLHNKLDNNYNYFEIILLEYYGIRKIDELLSNFTNIRVLELSKKVDFEVMHTALIENCIGDNLAILDLKHDSIENLMNMLDKIEKYDIVIGKRTKKIQTFFESVTSKIFYKIINLYIDTNIDSMYSDFFVINRKVINFITKNKDKVKFLKLLTFNNGFSKYEYDYTPLCKKSNKRSFFGNINFTIDILVNYSHRLIRSATIISLFMAVFNLLYAFYVLNIFIFKHSVAEGWVSSSLYSALSNFALFTILAVIGEYVRVILKNQRDTPLYEIVNERSSIALFSDTKNVDKE